MSVRRGKRPDGAIRRSQILTTAGPGALVDLVEHAVVIGGLDDWRYPSEDDGFIHEPRLEEKALKLLRATGYKAPRVRLRLPPACDDDRGSPSVGIAAREFPRWFLCQNPRCQSLVNRKALDDDRRHVCAINAKSSPVVPIRFVAACARGHLMDIHWRRFVHRGECEPGFEDKAHYCERQPGSRRPNDPLGGDWNSDLYLTNVGATGDITDYIVGCRRCGRVRGLQELVGREALGTCKGWRPWLPGKANEECPEDLRMLIRTASNVYFPQQVSVLSIGDPSAALREVVSRHWPVLHGCRNPDFFRSVLENYPNVRSDLATFDLDAVHEEVLRRLDDLPIVLPEIREAEWNALMRARIEVDSWEGPPADATWWARRHDPDEPLPGFLERVVLVDVLKEVRAQVGFTRIEGAPVGAEGDVRLDGQRTAALTVREDWVPAIEILGEGVFLAFEESAVRGWEARPAVRAIEDRFRRALLAERSRGEDAILPDARLLMLHSMAHMLITAISLECGYPASAIRERIYCYKEPIHDGMSEQERAQAMARSRAGILLYTGTPGSEGTLGGLVEVGRDIVRHLRRAAEMNLLCSNDPICARHDPSGHEEGRSREGAACHACLLIAEPSCERMNRDLDRTLVVPTVHEDRAAFLGGWV